VAAGAAVDSAAAMAAAVVDLADLAGEIRAAEGHPVIGNETPVDDNTELVITHG